MRNAKNLAFTLALACAFAAAHRACAQTGAPAQQPANSRLRGQQGTPAQRIAGQSLADILDKVDWDPAARGTLLIVSPEETFHSAAHTRAMTAAEVGIAPDAPEAEANGSYRLSRLGDYYDRRLVNLPTLTVFAPRTMVVLNATHLPKPDPFAGMSSEEKSQLLMSTFRPEQWRALASEEGIGAGDMDATQRDLYLSILPEPFTTRTQDVVVDAQGKSSPHFGDAVTFSPEQRASVRLSINKRIAWDFAKADGHREEAPVLLAKTPSLLLINPPTPRADKAIFGVVLRDEVPSRPKASQLPDDWSALDVAVVLGEAKTVGDIVRKIAAQMHASLYCDPRYEWLSLYTRGASVKAGDMLRALALAVTGTWRRLGNDFVLTDDILPLGARHALIADWIQENLLLRQTQNARIEKLLSDARVGSYIGWSATDPLKPSEALSQKIDLFNRQSASGDVTDGFSVPMNELPPAAQDLARQTLRGLVKFGLDNPQTGDPALRTDKVLLRTTTVENYVIPGLGTVFAPNIVSARIDTVLTGGEANASGRVAAALKPASLPNFPTLILPSTSAARALEVAPATIADIDAAATMAQSRGFTELWVHVAAGDTEMAAAAVRAGAACKVAVRPVIDLLRAWSVEKSNRVDTNILGETTSAHAMWWRTQLKLLGIPDSPTVDESARPSLTVLANEDAGSSENDSRIFAAGWRDAAAVDSLMRGGDFLRCDDGDVRSNLTDAITRTAQVVGIAGIVLRDDVAPGYAPAKPAEALADDTALSRDPMLQMGYTDAMRLAFLRLDGADPSDLSPLPDGDLINVGGMFGGYCDLRLPLFPDSGMSGASDTQTAEGKDARDSMANWIEYRHSVSEANVSAVTETLRAKAPGVAIFVSHEDKWLGSADLATGTDASVDVTGAPK